MQAVLDCRTLTIFRSRCREQPGSRPQAIPIACARRPSFLVGEFGRMHSDDESQRPRYLSAQARRYGSALKLLCKSTSRNSREQPCPVDLQDEAAEAIGELSKNGRSHRIPSAASASAPRISISQPTYAKVSTTPSHNRFTRPTDRK